MTFATLCDHCDRRIDYEYQWRVKIEIHPSTSWIKRAFVPGAGIPERKELHFCSKECVAAWATQPDEEVSDVPVQG